jgi:peptidoglycan biosynthesis protein MviN/MurJ (putative lipid II flippase)
MHRAVGTLDTGRLIGTLGRCAAASILLGAACWAALHWMHAWIFESAFVVRLVALLGVVGAGAAIYVGVCLLLRVEATEDAFAAVRRKLQRRAV